MVIRTIDNNNGTSTWTFEDGTAQIRCNDCSQWHHAGQGSIRHSKRCDTPTAQHAAPKAQVGLDIPKPRTANGLSSDELLAATRRGYLTQSQAMNRDF